MRSHACGCCTCCRGSGAVLCGRRSVWLLDQTLSDLCAAQRERPQTTVRCLRAASPRLISTDGGLQSNLSRMSFLGSVAFYLVTFVVIQYLGLRLLIGLVFKPRNLKRAYGAEWALVTGASSGTLDHPRPDPPPLPHSTTQHWPAGTCWPVASRLLARPRTCGASAARSKTGAAMTLSAATGKYCARDGSCQRTQGSAKR